MTVPDSLTAAEIDPGVARIHTPMRGVWDVWARWQIGKAIRQHYPDIVQTYMGRATRLTRLPLGNDRCMSLDWAAIMLRMAIAMLMPGWRTVLASTII